ncbi:hypothetical protein [Pelagicoccus sp. SDUM812003]|uniref:hypothetical protein n=1 Tax=Pelagicoccus sp. SDUM812003 TaxID=3041267 RepID=UPI00280F7783|nr:hypothetical protein [Pelagicoccus sp. SDUM812003]MDQ8205708.1 hypothetical protein [Pelagicoccus sp. SDUM812003]
MKTAILATLALLMFGCATIPVFPEATTVSSIVVKDRRGDGFEITEKSTISEILTLLNEAELIDHGYAHGSTTFAAGDMSIQVFHPTENGYTFYEMKNQSIWSQYGTWRLAEEKMIELQRILKENRSNQSAHTTPASAPR